MTTSVAVYGNPATKYRFDVMTTAGLSLLAIVSGLFLFVLP